VSPGASRWSRSPFDAASKQQAQDIVRRVAERFGRLDVLVTNAGILRPARLPEVTDDDYEEQMRVNFDHVFYTARAASRVLPPGGRICTVGSLSATRAPFPGFTAYCAAKGALAAFVRAAARDLGPQGITVNCVQPGGVDTDMNPADGPFSATVKALASLGKYGTPADVAELVSFVVSSRAGHITGAVLNIDGGDV
jgi:3-oxoacyl-[acyl-carrier protein] reductase